MKKIFRYLLTLSIIASLVAIFAVQSSAATIEYGDGKISYSISGDKVTITGYSTTKTDVVVEIPATYGGYTVVGIANNAFYWDDGVKEIILPDTITYVGKTAFWDCENLESITFMGLTGVTLSENIIEYCPSVKNITFGDLTDCTIEMGAFKGLSNLETVTFGNCENVKIKNEAFANTAIKNIVIPEGVSLGQFVFSECTSLETAVINGSPLHQIKVTTNSAGVETRREDVYSERLFNGCSNLKEVYLSSSYTKIYDSMFYECFALENVTADEVTEIGNHSFYRCTSLKSFELKNEVTVDSYAFSNCVSLEYLDFTKITKISTFSFWCCSSLDNIDLSGFDAIPSYCFYDCKSLKNVGDFKPRIINNNAFTYCESLTYIDFSNIEKIKREAFAGSGLASVDLSGNYEIGESAFACCPNIKEVYFSNSRELGYSAFYNCEGIEKIIIGDEVEYIKGVDLFGDCFNVKSVYIGAKFNGLYSNDTGEFAITKLAPETFFALEKYEVSPENPYYIADEGVLYGIFDDFAGVTENDYIILLSYPASKPEASYSTKNVLKDNQRYFSIADLAFYKSQYLKELELTNTVISSRSDAGINYILDRSFEESSVEKLTFTDDCHFEHIEERMFYNSKIKEIDLDGVIRIYDEAFYGCENLESVSSDTCKRIYASAFRGCTGLKSVDLPETTYIEGHVFRDCTSLVEVNLPKLNWVSNYTFYGCTSLKSISLESVSSVGNYAFYNCESLESVYCPELGDIGKYSFYGCKNLKEINTEELATIDDYAFEGCSSLKVILLQDIIEIGDYAFKDCAGLTLIQFADTECTFGTTPFENCPNLEFFCAENTSAYAYAIENNIPVTAVTINFQKDAYEYTGKEIEPSIIVSISGMTLTQNKDYTLSFENNIERGSGRLTVQFIGDFEGLPDAVRLFTITKADIANAQIEYVVDNEYSGEDIRPKVQVKYGDKILIEDVDYTITYNSGTDAGSMFFTVAGKGNYKGSIDCYYNIIRRDIAEATVSKDNDMVYTGEELAPKPTITWNGFTLVEDVDYEIRYFENVNSGYGTMVIYGLGNFCGTQRVQFRIFGKSLENAELSAIPEQTYTGNEITPEITVILDGVTLTKDTDYTVKYESNTEKGVATVVISGIGNYSGVAKQTFNIVKNSVYSFTVFSETEMTETYDGTPLKPEMEVYFGTELLTEGVDYTVSLENNVNAGTATVTVIGMGLYEGERSYDFTILPCEITENDISVSGNMEFNGSAVEPEITVFKNGTTLVEGEDYTVTYSNNNAVGTALVTIEGKGNYCDAVNLEYEIYEAEKEEITPPQDENVEDKNDSENENDTPVATPEVPENNEDAANGTNENTQNNVNNNTTENEDETEEENDNASTNENSQNPVIPNTDGEGYKIFNIMCMFISMTCQMAIVVIVSRKKKKA